MNATTRATFDELRGRFVKANPGRDPLTPPAQGLYDPSKEHDSCGVGFVADMKNRKSHDILEKGLQILVNLDHRGAVGADPSLGDGCRGTELPQVLLGDIDAPAVEVLGYVTQETFVAHYTQMVEGIDGWFKGEPVRRLA